MTHSIELYSCRVVPSDLVRLEADYLQRLNSLEVARYRKFGALSRRLEWLAGRALVLEALPLSIGRINERQLCTGSNGNISYPDASIHLSLSHSKGLVALAIATIPAGIDVERVSKRSIVTYAQQVFAPVEAAHIAQSATIEQLRLFYRYWTLKEAVSKAAGLSIWEGLAAAQFDLQSVPGFAGTTKRLKGSWRFWTADIDTHWQLAVAGHGLLPAGSFTAWRIPLPGLREKLKLSALQSFAHAQHG